MNTMNDLHSKILRKFHTLCGVVGLTQDEKRALVTSYGVESSADLDTHALIDLCAHLDGEANKQYKIQDKLRKQVMAAIGSYLNKTGQQSSSAIVKGIACRATGYSDFNKIPIERLRNIYNAFVNKQKDITAIDAITDGMIISALSANRAVMN